MVIISLTLEQTEKTILIVSMVFELSLEGQVWFYSMYGYGGKG